MNMYTGLLLVSEVIYNYISIFSKNDILFLFKLLVLIKQTYVKKSLVYSLTKTTVQYVKTKKVTGLLEHFNMYCFKNLFSMIFYSF